MNQLNILLLGSGGRESALARKISESPRCAKLWIAPGNAGTGAYGTTVASLKPLDFDAIKAFVADNAIDMIVVGNEDPLVAGIYDYFENEPVLVVGPSRAAAALEGSKDFAKEFMARHAIPTAAYRTFSAETLREGQEFLSTLQAPYVLKADGLAAGKGVLIISDLKEAQDALAEMLGGQFGESSRKVVIEEFLSGIECSVFVLTDGNGGYRILPVAKDYKRIGEGDTGPNTGGMGAVSPVVFADREFMDKVEQRIILPTVNGLKQEGLTYRGFIFLGLINCDGEPKAIEYNVRMGDPETEVVMPRLASDLVDLLEGAARGDLGDIPAEHDPRPAAIVIAVSGGYPGDYAKGYPIEFGADGDSIVFHAGTAFDADGRVVTAGGRVLAVTSFGDTLAQALEKSYATLKGIKFQDMNYRRDIGRDVLKLMGEI